MAELINKKEALAQIKSIPCATLEEFACKELAESRIKRLPTTTEAEIRAKAYDKVCNAISNLLSGDTKHLEGGAYYKELAYLEVLHMAEQLKEE